MKLCEISTEKTLDVLCELTPHVCAIVKDDVIVKAITSKVTFGKEVSKEEIKEGVLNDWIGKFETLIPLLLKKYRENVFNIISILNEKTLEEVRTQSVITTIKEVKEIILDSDFLNFLQEFMK